MANPKDIANKWARRLGGATEDIRRGVQEVNKAPSEIAISKKDKFIAELMRAIQEGKWENSLRGYTLEDWKKDMIERGISRIASGAEASKTDVEEFLSKFLPYAESVANEVAKMPDTTIEDRINKAIYVMRKLHEFKY